MENFYQILGVAPDASTDEIKSRFRFLAKAYHPDRFTDSETKAQAENEMKRLNEAYSILSSPEKRRAYDAQIRGGSTESAGQTGDSREPEEDQVYQKQTAKMIVYLQQLEKHWEYLLKPLPNLTRVYDVSEYLHQVVAGLMTKVFPGNSAVQNEAMIVQIDQRIFRMVVLNICLGAEFEKYGYPRQFQPVELQILTSLPVQQLLYELFEIGQKRGRISESDVQEMGDTFARGLLQICELAQKAGCGAVTQRSGIKQSVDASFQSTSARNPSSQPVRSSTSNGILGYCQSCLRHEPTARISFNQNIGYFYMRRYKTIEGELCADCIEGYFWEMTGKTFFFGWWGIISFIITPFILLGNLFNYLRAWGLRTHSNRLSSIATGWKTSVFMALVVILLLVIFSSKINNYVYTTSRSSTPLVRNTSSPSGNVVAPSRPIPTKPALRPTATEPICTLWSDVGTGDKDKKLCVYGSVQKAYWGGNIYYISFSDDSNAFRFIVLQGYYFEGLQGNCVMAEGIVKTYGKMPYIEVGENLWKCE